MEIYKHKVQYYETDKMGITHHSNYIRWMEEARIDFCGKIGWSYDTLEKNGIMSPVIGVECKYKLNTTFADIIEIEIFVEEFSGVRLKLRYEMKRDGKLVCEGKTEHCFMSPDGKILRLKKEHPALFELFTNMAENK